MAPTRKRLAELRMAVASPSGYDRRRFRPFRGRRRGAGAFYRPPLFLYSNGGKSYVDLCACKEGSSLASMEASIPRPEEERRPKQTPAAYTECRNPGAGWEAAPGLGLESKLAMAGQQDQTITRIFSVRRVSSAQVPANPMTDRNPRPCNGALSHVDHRPSQQRHRQRNSTMLPRPRNSLSVG